WARGWPGTKKSRSSMLGSSFNTKLQKEGQEIEFFLRMMNTRWLKAREGVLSPEELGPVGRGVLPLCKMRKNQLIPQFPMWERETSTSFGWRCTSVLYGCPFHLDS